MPTKLLTPKEAAARLHLSVRTVYKLLRTGQLPAKKYGGSWRIAEQDLLPNSYAEASVEKQASQEKKPAA